VVVRGHAQGVRSAAEYFDGTTHAQLWPVVVDALESLRSQFDLVIAEGAGSPAEINLRDRDLVNMRVALHAGADVLIVSDIDRGGAFAALLGTWEWLTQEERALVRGFILNMFRGDASLLAPGPALREARTGVPVVGVVPYLTDLVLPEEDAASLTERPRSFAPLRMTHPACVEITVVKLPHLSNFDEFAGLAAEPGVDLRYVSQPQELRAPDLVIVPGSKSTIPDVIWLHARGLSDRIRWLAQRGTPVLGICGGYQMLGERVTDPEHLESAYTEAAGMSLLPIQTELAGAKRLVRTRGRARNGLPGLWACLEGLEVEGYEIHVGRTAGPPVAALFDLSDGPDGAVSSDGGVAGTSLPGVFERQEPRHALLRALARVRGFNWSPVASGEADAYDVLADTLEQALHLEVLPCLRSYTGTRRRALTRGAAGGGAWM
jgi:adenosylcobyric acid synthase